MGLEYITLETLKKSDKAIVEVAMMDDYPERVVVKHLKGVNINLFHQISFLHSVYIPKIYKCELDGEWFVVIEEYLEGENLEKYLREHRLTDKQKLDIALLLCEAVKCLHMLQPPIIHRDIKPHNIIINEHGALKLIDFDASRYYREDDNRQDTRLLGTPEYAPPEQYGYSQTDVRSDIYSMGMVFKELNLTEKKFLISRWEKMVGKCRNFDPKHRYQTVDELEKEIKKMAFLRTITGKTVLSWTVAVLLLLIVLWQGCMLTRNNDTMVDNQNVVTGMPTPTEDVQESMTPEPTATNTPVPTETPTQAVEPTAEPTATSTPLPTEMPSDKLAAIEALGTHLNQTTRVYNYYLDMDDKNGLHLPASLSFVDGLSLERVIFYEHLTETEIEVPMEMLSSENGYVLVSEEFLETLENVYYNVTVDYKDANGGRYGIKDDYGIHKKQNGNITEQVLANANQSYYKVYPMECAVFVSDAHTIKITGLYMDITDMIGAKVVWENNSLQIVDSSNYQISPKGNYVVVSKEFLSQYVEKETLYLYAACDDGSYRPFWIKYRDDVPPWMK